jgi:hypothetical protein
MSDPADNPVLDELLASVRHWLAQPGDEDTALFDATDAVQATLSLTWDRATGTPAERFAVALRAAGELLDALGLALANGDKAEG